MGHPLTKRKGRIAGLLLAFTLVFTASPATASEQATEAPREFGVMTQNLYLGADLAPVFGATGADLIAAAADIYDHMLQVDFQERSGAIAALVAEERPYVIGLQEVALWQKLQAAEAGWQVVETTDYLTILVEALAAEGVAYRVAAVNTNFSNEAFPLPITFDLQTAATLTMRDAILVRDSLSTSELRVLGGASGNYAAATSVPSPGDPTAALPVLRGWSSIDVKVRGKEYRFVNTHLEAFSGFGCENGEPSLAEPFVRNRQAKELVDLLGASPYPVVLAGDLNALPDNPCDAMPIFYEAGYKDAWAEAMPGIPAYTAGQTDDLDNNPSQLDHQVDYVLFSDPDTLDSVDGSGVIIGEEPDDRTASGLWPSDHAGLFVAMHIAKP